MEGLSDTSENRHNLLYINIIIIYLFIIIFNIYQIYLKNLDIILLKVD